MSSIETSLRLDSRRAFGFLGVTLLAAVTSVGAQGRADDYRRAEQFLPWNVTRLAPTFAIEAQWQDSGSRFVYRAATAGGTQFLLVDPERRTQRPAFDHAALATALSAASGTRYQPLALPFASFTRVDAGHAIRFDLGGRTWQCRLQPAACELVTQWRPGPEEAASPDGRQVAFVRSHDLYVRSVEAGTETRLTDDGEPFNDYASRAESNQSTATEERLGIKQPPIVAWAPDSRRIAFLRLDQRKVGLLHLTQAVPADGGVRPKTFAYRMPLPGDENVATAELWIGDTRTGKRVKVQVDPIVVLLATPIEFRMIWWSEDGERVYVVLEDRGFRRLRLFEVEPNTGTARQIVEERSRTYAELYLNHYSRLPTVSSLSKGAEVLWYSERDGWAHLYLYDARTGTVKNQVTSGPWVVRDVQRVDEARRQVYFRAGGKDPGRNPYHRQLYRINLDGSGLRLITPENGDHEIQWSPDGRYFVDTYSRADTLPVAVVRTAEGVVVQRLGSDVDLTALVRSGWRWPEQIVVKAADDTTSIYGLLYRPTNFDSTKKYPVIDAVYPGPQALRGETSYPADGRGAYFYWYPQALAELGFVVVIIEGRGTPFRSKAFHDVSYGNLGDGGGLVDHIAGLRQLAARRPYLDLTRVGVVGGSAGGYATARAMLKYPDFYRVGAALALYSGPSAFVAWWGERYQGYPVDREAYRVNDNESLAGNLKGKLLMITGEVDEATAPTMTLRLVNALIDANKDFELLIMPNRNHGPSQQDPYSIRRVWDHFVRNLLGVVPPEGYRIQGPPPVPPTLAN